MSGFLTTENTENTEGATPETDAFSVKFKSVCGSKAWVPTDICRRFERERDEARNECKALWSLVETEKKKAYNFRQERDEAREQLADWENAAAHVEENHPDEVHCGCVPVLRKLLADARKERDEAIADRDIARLSALESDRAHDRMVGELEGVYKERDEAREALEYVACSGLSARHLKDYAVDFLKRLEARP